MDAVASPQLPSDLSERTGLSWKLAPIVVLLLALAPMLPWPGDVEWAGDHPILIAHAWKANHSHSLTRRGLTGSLPVPYGPMPTQFYQLLLLFSHDVRMLVVLRGIICAAATAGALLWLGRTLRLTPWFVAGVVIGPYMIWSERTLWDCSLAVPVGSIAVAAYASFLATKCGKALVIALTAAVVVPLIHFQGLPLCIAIVGHALWRNWAAIKQNRVGLLSAAVAVLLLNGLYILRVTQIVLFPSLGARHHDAGLMEMLKSGHNAKAPFLQAISGPFLGGRIFAGNEFVNGGSQAAILNGPHALNAVASRISMTPIALVWLGIALAMFLVIKRGGEGTSNRRTLAGIALTCLILQVLMVGMLRCPPYVHYGYGMFPFFALLAWIAIDWLRQIKLGNVVLMAWCASLAYVTIATTLAVHRNGYGRNTAMSPLLDDQIAVMDLFHRYSDVPVWTTVPQFDNPPRSLLCLRLLNRPVPKTDLRIGGVNLLIRYRPELSSGNRIELIELASPNDVPPNAKRLDLTPIEDY